jgi:hypothetical protein
LAGVRKLCIAIVKCQGRGAEGKETQERNPSHLNTPYLKAARVIFNTLLDTRIDYTPVHAHEPTPGGVFIRAHKKTTRQLFFMRRNRGQIGRMIWLSEIRSLQRRGKIRKRLRSSETTWELAPTLLGETVTDRFLAVLRLLVGDSRSGKKSASNAARRLEFHKSRNLILTRGGLPGVRAKHTIGGSNICQSSGRAPLCQLLRRLLVLARWSVGLVLLTARLHSSAARLTIDF